ncbi:PH domain-containing protein [Kineosporia succinea]|uniref:Membrane protein YdbS with pleckstrin-like domain n=1 Tax=Kineosporia succinea TaxID=84632 RepID=A0ABT9P4J4_9ACTN|nr:PH domain-containing protein [Kineosporia succinea]MDP9827614.1 membrane protein YdbS with pleckstrin-like domain [Kineosporia succinea]
MVGHSERFGPGVPKELDRYLIPSEQIVFMLRRHWVVLAEPTATAVFGLLILAWVSNAASGLFVQILTVVWLLLLSRLILKAWEWYEELFLATDRRLMLVHGIITRQVDIMPMSKVTDMRYDRTVTGQILGYGKFVMESAGQDQALSTINYIPDSDLHYQQISQIIFAPSERKVTTKATAPGSRVPITEPEQAWWRRKA